MPALVVERLAAPFGGRPGTAGTRGATDVAGGASPGGIVDVSVTLAPGGRLAVVGPSGAGKTTLLRAIAGLAPVTAGRVVVRERDVTARPPEDRDVVYLHQTPVLFEHLSVGENVAFPLRVRRVPGADVRARVHAALAAVRLPDVERRAPHTLSGGQRHRVALARALAARPAVLLLDEPLSALDPGLRDEVREAIAGLRAGELDAGAPAMILVTHDLDDAGLLADAVAVLLDGRIVQVAPPAELFTRPATLGVARLLGTYQTLDGWVAEDGVTECALGRLPNETRLRPGTRVVVAFRRDALRVTPACARAAGAGCTGARVVGVRHRAEGASVVLRLDVEAESPLLEAPLASRDAASVPEVGGSCGVVLNAAAAHVFPA